MIAALALYPIALAGAITFTTAAICPEAFATKLYSPSARHEVDPDPHKGCVVSPFVYLGSKTQAAPGAKPPPRVNLRVGPPPRGVNAMAGTVAVAPTF